MRYNQKRDKVQLLTPEGDKYAFDVQEMPEQVKRPNFPAGEYVFTLNKEATGVTRLYPTMGQFTGKCIGFAHKKDEDPAPIERTSPWGNSLEFTALVEILEPQEFQGLVVPYKGLRYDKFVQGPTGDVDIRDEPKGKHANALDAFLYAAGAWVAGPLAFSGKILPALQERIQKEKQEFRFVLMTKKGWTNIEAVFPLEATTTDFSDDDDLAPWETDSDDESEEAEEMGWE